MTNVLKKEYIIKYSFNNTPNIKHLKNEYESIRRKVLENDENSINKIDMENSKTQNNKNIINKKILDFKIV